MSEHSDYYIVRIPGSTSSGELRGAASAEHVFADGNTARVFEVDGRPHSVVEVHTGDPAPTPPLQVVAGPLTAAEARDWIAANDDDAGGDE